MLSVVSREGAWQCHSHCSGVYPASIITCCKTNANYYFCFMLFFLKWKCSFNFFQLAKTGTNVSHKSIKAKWGKVYFSKQGRPVFSPEKLSHRDLNMDSDFPDKQALSIGPPRSLISVHPLYPQTATGVCFIGVAGRQLQSTKRWEFWPDSHR